MVHDTNNSIDRLYLERDSIRWLMYDNKKANRAMVQVFEKGMSVNDWEMQLNCMLACAHFGLKKLLPVVRNTKFFFKSRNEVNAEIYPLIQQVQKVIIDYLSSTLKPLRLQAAPFINREVYILHCILRKKIDRATDLSLFLNSMMIPNGIRPVEPHMPASIRLINHKYYLKDSKIEFVHVPPFAHWIGSSSVPENPTEHTKIKSGFFISKFPLALQPLKVPSKKDYLYLDYQEMRDLVAFLSKKYDTKLIVPSVHTSEMASRGQTGRLYPWGNQIEDQSYNVSPWSMEEAFGSVEWWTSSKFDEENSYTYGSWKQKNCAGRVTAPHMLKRAVRVAISGVLT